VLRAASCAPEYQMRMLYYVEVAKWPWNCWLVMIYSRNQIVYLSHGTRNA
jgi:hypothetical protein